VHSPPLNERAAAGGHETITKADAVSGSTCMPFFCFARISSKK
jgi:hypothetical protein